MQNNNGKLLITKTTLENIVTSTLKEFPNIKKSELSVKFGTEDNINISIIINVEEGTIIKDLSTKIQSKVKKNIKETTNIDLGSVDIEIESVEIKKSETEEDKKNIIKDSETFITESKTKLEELGKQKQELIALIEAEENKVIDFTENEEYAKLTKEIEELEQDLKITNISNNTSITEEKNKLNERINEIQVKLNEKTTYEKAQARIEELEKEEQELAQHIADCEKMEYLIEEFIRVKTEKLEQAINSKFELVNIKLFSEQINGGLIETCEVVVNGVPFSDLNNAMKINAGLDIIRTLADNYDKHAPIFIDNAESVNELVKVNTQLIRLVVSKDKELRIEN